MVKSTTRFLGAAAIAAATIAAAPAYAATVSAALPVTATVAASCAISTLPVAFGNVLNLGTVFNNGTGSVTVNCINGVLWSVDLDPGLAPNFSDRRMTTSGLSGATVVYQLYTDAAHTTVWGSASGGSAVTGTGSGASQVNTVYGRTQLGSSAPIGNYSDTVTVSITF